VTATTLGRTFRGGETQRYGIGPVQRQSPSCHVVRCGQVATDPSLWRLTLRSNQQKPHPPPRLPPHPYASPTPPPHQTGMPGPSRTRDGLPSGSFGLVSPDRRPEETVSNGPSSPRPTSSVIPNGAQRRGIPRRSRYVGVPVPPAAGDSSQARNDKDRGRPSDLSGVTVSLGWRPVRHVPNRNLSGACVAWRAHVYPELGRGREPSPSGMEGGTAGGSAPTASISGRLEMEMQPIHENGHPVLGAPAVTIGLPGQCQRIEMRPVMLRIGWFRQM
jgi:hypothetical protein